MAKVYRIENRSKPGLFFFVFLLVYSVASSHQESRIREGVKTLLKPLFSEQVKVTHGEEKTVVKRLLF